MKGMSEMKRKIIELLIRWWMPKYRLAKRRGPYKKKSKEGYVHDGYALTGTGEL